MVFCAFPGTDVIVYNRRNIVLFLLYFKYLIKEKSISFLKTITDIFESIIISDKMLSQYRKITSFKNIFVLNKKYFSSASKESRINRVEAFKSKNSQNVQFSNKKILISVSSIVACVFGISVLNEKINDKESEISKLYWGSSIQLFISSIYDKTFGEINQVFDPSSDKLIPDWGNPTFYPNIPPGTPAPPLLVLDLEKTCIGSVYDAKTGWKHVKRPGLDEFLNQLHQYYEIVLFTENDIGVQQQVMLAIDKENRCHKLGSAAAEFRNNIMLKRLDNMNRDIRKIILIDDDEKAPQLFPRNTLLVKPYNDVFDKSDRILYDLIPLLQALVHEQPDDFRNTLDELGTHDADEAATEYSMSNLLLIGYFRISLICELFYYLLGVSAKKRSEEEKRNRGLGGIIRNSKRISKTSVDTEETISKSKVMSAAQIVGNNPSNKPNDGVRNNNKNEIVPPVTKKKGELFGWIERQNKEKEEYELRRIEKMNELHGKKMLRKNKNSEE